MAQSSIPSAYPHGAANDPAWIAPAPPGEPYAGPGADYAAMDPKQALKDAKLASIVAATRESARMYGGQVTEVAEVAAPYPHFPIDRSQNGEVTGGSATSATPVRKRPARDRRRYDAHEYRGIGVWLREACWSHKHGMHHDSLYAAYCAWCLAPRADRGMPYDALPEIVWGRELHALGYPSLARRTGRYRLLILRRYVPTSAGYFPMSTG